jgi:hypothetical protein
MRTTEYVYRIANPIMLKKRHCKCRLTGGNAIINRVLQDIFY